MIDDEQSRFEEKFNNILSKLESSDEPLLEDAIHMLSEMEIFDDNSADDRITKSVLYNNQLNKIESLLISYQEENKNLYRNNIMLMEKIVRILETMNKRKDLYFENNNIVTDHRLVFPIIFLIIMTGLFFISVFG